MTALSLGGLSVGDALGAQYFVPGNVAGRLPDGLWPWTDDTEMACSIVAELRSREGDRPGHGPVRRHPAGVAFPPGALATVVRAVTNDRPTPAR